MTESDHGFTRETPVFTNLKKNFHTRVHQCFFRPIHVLILFFRAIFIPMTKILDVGCGANKYEGAIGLDNNPRTAADVIHDLGVVPYPFADDEFDLVVSRHVIEHVPDVMAFVGELYRITRHGGTIRLVTPHYTNPDWATDPTHRNHFNSYSFNTFAPEKAVFDFYTDIHLKPVRTYASLLNLWKALGLEFAVNLDQKAPKFRFLRKFWEHYLSSIVRGKELHFEFEVVKNNQLDLAADERR